MKTIAQFLSIAVSCSAITLSPAAKLPAPATRPNIVFILTDDQRWDSLGVNGNPIVKTPNIDKLAKSGVIFQNAYVTTSICCVSRASILSGQYESRHGINNFDTDFTPEQLAQTYPMLLRRAGYKTAFVGKYGVGKQQPSETFDFWECNDKGQPHYITTDKAGNEVHDTDKVTSSALKFLGEYSNKGPFCLSISYKAPHEQDGQPPDFIPQKRFLGLFASDTFPVPETGAAKFWDAMPDFFHNKKNIARQRWQDLFSTPEKYQENVKDYYRLIAGLDDAVGHIHQKLKDENLTSNTVIIYMGDNGFLLGEHGLEGKWFGYEESIRVPLFISYPGLPKNLVGSRSKSIALNIDIAPTILGLAGVQTPKSIQGVDLIALLKRTIPSRESFFYEHTYLKSPKLPNVEGVVTTDIKYMKYPEHNFEELFSIAADPHETNNLVNDPNYANILDDMRSKYKALKQSVK